MIFYYYNSAYEHIFVKLIYIDRYTVYRAWVYIGFVNGGLEILWCEYLWVGKFKKYEVL